MTKQDITKLVRHMRGLVELDVQGITSTDARNTVSDWLQEMGEPDLADYFSHEAYKYQTSKKIAKMEEEYSNQI